MTPLSRTYNSFQPRRRRDTNADRRRSSAIQVADTISATTAKNVLVAPSAIKIVRAWLVADGSVSGLNESYWTFNLKNKTKGDLGLFTYPPTTQNSTGDNPLGGITEDTVYHLNPNTNLYMDKDDVLEFSATKSGSASNIVRAKVVVEYEVEEGSREGTTTSSSTTTTSSSTTTTSSSTTTTSSSTTTTSSSTTTTSSSTTTTSSSTTSTTTTTVSTSTSVT